MPARQFPFGCITAFLLAGAAAPALATPMLLEEVSFDAFQFNSTWRWQNTPANNGEIIGQEGGDIFSFGNAPRSVGAGFLTLEARGDYNTLNPPGTTFPQTGPTVLRPGTSPNSEQLDSIDFSDEFEGLAFGFNCDIARLEPGSGIRFPENCAGTSSDRPHGLGNGLHSFGTLTGAALIASDPNAIYDHTIRQQFIIEPDYMRLITEAGSISLLFFPIGDSIDATFQPQNYFSARLTYFAEAKHVPEPGSLPLMLIAFLAIAWRRRTIAAAL